MNISRGFRRLSVVAAFLGLMVIVYLWTQPDSHPTPAQLLAGIVVFSGLPALFVLLLGWAIAGFQKST